MMGAWRPAPVQLASTAVRPDGRIVLSVFYPDNWFFSAGLLNPSLRRAPWADASVLHPVSAGSTVTGVVSMTERPGRVKGVAQLHLRYETLTPPGSKEHSLQATTAAVQDKGRQPRRPPDGQPIGTTDEHK